MKIAFSKRVFAIVIAIFLLLSAVNMYMIFSIQRDFRSDDSTFNYVIYNEGGLVKAKNQQSGLVDFASATASNVINQAIAAGNHVYLKAGTYTLTGDIQILNGQNARIVSNGANLTANGFGIIIKGSNYTRSKENEVSGLTLINGTLRIENSFATTISSMTFENCTTALELVNTDTWTEATKMEDIHFTNCTESIRFRTPSGGNATGSYASTEISRCFFKLQDNSVGINVEKGAEFSDSQLFNSRMWLGENGRSNQTGLLVDGAMFQSLISGVVFESFADSPNNMYAIAIGQNANPAPILGDGVSFLGNWTARIYNPNNVWLSGTGTEFRRSENIPIGTGNAYGGIVNIHDRPLTISSFKSRIQVQGNIGAGEIVTVRVRIEFVDNVISPSIEKPFTNTTSIWLTDDEILRLFPSQDIVWAILVDAKTTSAYTSASVSVDIYGIAT